MYINTIFFIKKGLDEFFNSCHSKNIYIIFYLDELDFKIC